MTNESLPGKLPEWPEPEDFCTPAVDKWYEAVKYHVAMTAYWESRARLAIAALDKLLAVRGDHMTACDRTMGDSHACTCGATLFRRTLEYIGPLPEEDRT